MLSDAEIKEILERCCKLNTPLYSDTFVLLATVKEQRELLNTASEYMRHAPGCNGEFPPHKCSCGFEAAKKQIEEALK